MQNGEGVCFLLRSPNEPDEDISRQHRDGGERYAYAEKVTVFDFYAFLAEYAYRGDICRRADRCQSVAPISKPK